MTTIVIGASPTELAEMPVEEVARRLFAVLTQPGDQTRIRLVDVLQTYESTLPVEQRPRPEIRPLRVRPLAEGWQWLIQHGLLCQNGRADDEWMLSRRAVSFRRDEDPFAIVKVEARLDVDLHARIAKEVRSIAASGSLDAAVHHAHKIVEVRLREISGLEAQGKELVTKAFAAGGPLAPYTPDDIDATKFLFAGAVGVLRNPASHTEVSYDEPIEAVDAILVADLLLRILDRIEARRDGRPDRPG